MKQLDLGIWQTEIEVSADLAEQVYQLRRSGDQQNRSNLGGWESILYWDLELQPWINYVNLSSNLVGSAWVSKPDCLTYWFNINGPGATNHWHRHSSLVTGVLYLQAPPGAGLIEFRDQAKLLSIKPHVGLFLAFPSKLEHRVLTNESLGDRISMAFMWSPQSESN